MITMDKNEIILTKEQNNILKTLNNDQEYIVINAFAGASKAQPLYSKILTPSGWTTMGKIKINDDIIGSDGNIYQVVGVYPQGVKKINRVTFSDDFYTDCCDEHLWSTKTDKERFYKKQPTVKTTLDLKNTLYESNKNKTRIVKNHSIEWCKPINFPKRELNIHPYVLGIIIGDGSIDSNGNVIITNPEIDVMDKVKRYLPENIYLKTRDYKDRCIAYGINCNTRYNVFSKYIKEYGLNGKKSWEKYIPDDYMLSSVEDRLNLLQGLIDSDGCVNKNTSNVTYTTTSKKLAENIIDLVQSLGGRITISEKMGKYTKNNITKETRVFYSLNILFYNNIIPVSSEKHLSRFVKAKRQYERYIKNIEQIGEEECQCIRVNAPNSLYITDNYILTHNTTICIELIKEMLKNNNSSKILYTCFNKLIMEEAKSKFKRLGLNIECRTAHSLALKELQKIKKVELIFYLDYDFFKKKKKDKKSTFIGVKYLIDKYTSCDFNMEEFKTISSDNLYKDNKITAYENRDIDEFENIYNLLIKENKYMHNMYLKEFALLNTSIEEFDYVLVDESQDLDTAMLSILKNMKCKKKYIVGDSFQTIYASFRDTVNALDILAEEDKSNVYPLSKSFRFHDDIAELANVILEGSGSVLKLKGNGKNKNKNVCDKNITVLFRSNFGILNWACKRLKLEKNIKFNFNGISDGKSAKDFNELYYDFISLLKLMSQDKKDKYFESELDRFFPVLKLSPRVLKMKKIASEEKKSLSGYLREQCEKNVMLDQDLVNYWKFAEVTWVDLINKLRSLENSQYVKNPDKIYTLYTTHKAKGCEWDNVIIAEDCWYSHEYGVDDEDYKQEAMNIIYVALTRSKEKLTIESEIINDLLNIEGEKALNDFFSSGDSFTSVELEDGTIEDDYLETEETWGE